MPTPLEETFEATGELLAAEFQPPPRPPGHWRDPSGGLPMPPLEVLGGPAAEHLPRIYGVFEGVPADICWRTVAAEVFTHNIDVDKRLEKSAQLRALIGGQALPPTYHQPLPSALAKTQLDPPPPGTRWCVYLTPWLGKPGEVVTRAIEDLIRRDLGFRELHGTAYAAIDPSPEMPPILVVRSPDAPEGSKPHVLEGVFRLARAVDASMTEVPTRLVEWRYVERFVHLQPFSGTVQWQR